jgi:hypothetical protein
LSVLERGALYGVCLCQHIASPLHERDGHQIPPVPNFSVTRYPMSSIGRHIMLRDPYEYHHAWLAQCWQNGRSVRECRSTLWRILNLPRSCCPSPQFESPANHGHGPLSRNSQHLSILLCTNRDSMSLCVYAADGHSMMPVEFLTEAHKQSSAKESRALQECIL